MIATYISLFSLAAAAFGASITIPGRGNNTYIPQILTPDPNAPVESYWTVNDTATVTWDTSTIPHANIHDTLEGIYLIARDNSIGQPSRTPVLAVSNVPLATGKVSFTVPNVAIGYYTIGITPWGGNMTIPTAGGSDGPFIILTELFVPKFTNIGANTVWTSGSKQVVNWDTTGIPLLPSPMVNLNLYAGILGLHVLVEPLLPSAISVVGGTVTVTVPTPWLPLTEPIYFVAWEDQLRTYFDKPSQYFRIEDSTSHSNSTQN